MSAPGRTLLQRIDETIPVSPDEAMLVDTVRAASREFAKRAEHHDRTGEFPWENVKALNALGLNGMFVPEEYGGAPTSFASYLACVREISRACASTGIVWATSFHAMKPLIEFGNDDQKRRLLPRIAEGGLGALCITEPTAGSDATGMKTRFRPDGDHVVVNGSKTFITNGLLAGIVLVVCKTDPAKGSHGTSILILEAKDCPGFRVGRVLDKMGLKAQDTSEHFFDDVKVPAENLVHEEGKGWTVAKYLLGYERMNTGRIGESRRQLAALKEYSTHLTGDVRFRDRLSRLEIELMALEITNLRFLDRMRRTGQPPGADVSMLKIKGTEIQQGITELMLQAADPVASDAFTEAVRKKYLSMRKTTIYAGSNEIQRNIIAKMTLGL
jgi:acyl-CoA dehydrogenase